MDSSLSSHLQHPPEKLHKNFTAAQPFPYIAVDNFLEESFAKELWQSFPSFDTKKAVNELGYVGGKATREDVKNLGTAYLKLDDLFSSSAFLEWMSALTGIPNLLYDPDYTGGGTHENLPGQDLNVHIDFNYHPTRGWYRRVNVLLYLNPEWEESWGGNLELWRDPWKPRKENLVVDIAPIWNRLVVFNTTEASWHGFQTIRVPEEAKGHSRKSIALYLYTKEAPAGAAHPLHSTIYYEREIPESVQPEKVLSKADWDEIRRLTARRDDLIKYLYHREYKFSDLIQGLQNQLKKQEERMDWLKTISSERENTPYSPVFVTRYERDLFRVYAGLWNKPSFGKYFTFEALKFPPREGKLVLIKTDRANFDQLVYFARDLGDFFVAYQPVAPHTLLLHKDHIHATVRQIWNPLGQLLTLTEPTLAIPLKALWVAKIFVLLHTIKKFLIGNRKSSLLWKLSLVYRKCITCFGIHVPVLPPK